MSRPSSGGKLRPNHWRLQTGGAPPGTAHSKRWPRLRRKIRGDCLGEMAPWLMFAPMVRGHLGLLALDSIGYGG